MKSMTLQQFNPRRFDLYKTERVDGSPRPGIDEMMFRVCEVIRERSACPAGKRHAAVLVMDRRILSTGYNGPACGVDTHKVCTWDIDKACPCVHAEQNAINTAARHGVSVLGATLYVTKRPCDACERSCLNAGIQTVYYLEES